MKLSRTIVTSLLSCLLFQCAPQQTPDAARAEIDAAPRGALVGSPDPALFAMLAKNRVLGAHVGAAVPASPK